MQRSTIVFGLIAIVLSSIATDALAANRTVCFRLQLRDERENCPTSGTAGARRPCNPGGYADMLGHQVELWDKDWNTGDDKIGTWYMGGSGTQCITFPWEGAPYGLGESDPDLYLRYINRVNRTGYSNYRYVDGRDGSGSDVSNTSWRNGTAADPDRYVALNCKAGTTCSVFSGTLTPTNDVASDRAQRIMSLDSAQHSLQIYGEGGNRNIELRYPAPGGTCGGGSCALSREVFQVSSTRGDDAQSTTHELGHVWQMQEFNQDDLRDACGSSHSFTSIEAESCVTTEGFANYAGAVAWWSPENASSNPQRWGTSFETAAPQFGICADNTQVELQAAKAFWDLDDANNETGAGAATGEDDLRNESSTTIMDGWDRFADGTSNRQDFENDNDGVNVRDYFANNSAVFTGVTFTETLLNHNCVQSMDNN
jgi:hypothetical protein